MAESCRTLESLFPGRIDLGIGRAPGTDQVSAPAPRRSPEALHAEDFPAQLGELLAFAEGGFPAGHLFRSVRAMPEDAPLPPIYLLGSSGYSADLVARIGRASLALHRPVPPMASGE